MYLEKKNIYIAGTPWYFVSPGSHISQYISKTLIYVRFWYIIVKKPSALATNIFHNNIQYLLYISDTVVITDFTWLIILEENVNVLNWTPEVFGRKLLLIQVRS